MINGHTCIKDDGGSVFWKRCEACEAEKQAAAPRVVEGRRPLDFYETPEWQTVALLDRIPIRGSVLEPCVGDGAIANVLKSRWPMASASESCLITNDIDPARTADYTLDAAQDELWERVGLVDWVVTNPAFNVAMPIVQRAQQRAKKGVAMLLRISFPEPTKTRGPWLEAHPPDGLIYLPRWSYKANGQSDSATTAWMLWLNDPLLKRPYGRIWVHKEKPVRQQLRDAA